MKDVFKRILQWLSLVGPGLFCLGITVGTGSVTSMVKAGSEYGTSLLWVLALSAFFTWVMTDAYGRYALCSGDTAMHGIKNRIKGGTIWAALLIIGLSVSQWISLSSIANITSNAVAEVLKICIPGISETGSHIIVIVAAFLILGSIWLIINTTNYHGFEKILSVVVTLMGTSFIISMFIELPEPQSIARGFVPSLPKSADSRLFIAAFVGTTMAAPSYVLRPLMLKSKGWTSSDSKQQRKDSVVSATLSFIVSGAIMMCAAGVLFARGLTVDKVLDMIYVLEPIAGKFAVALFVVGLLCAGLSSLIPLMMLPPVLIADFKSSEMGTGTKCYKILTAVSALLGMTIPVLGFNPIIAQITSQVTQVFVLPFVILLMIILINRKDVMGGKTPGPVYNICMVLALVFACVVSYTAVIALGGLF